MAISRSRSLRYVSATPRFRDGGQGPVQSTVCLRHFDFAQASSTRADQHQGVLQRSPASTSPASADVTARSKRGVTRSSAPRGSCEVIDLHAGPDRGPCKQGRPRSVRVVGALIAGPCRFAARCHPALTKTRGDKIIWNAAARCLRPPGMRFSWSSRYPLAARARGSPPSAAAPGASHSSSSCASRAG